MNFLGTTVITQSISYNLDYLTTTFTYPLIYSHLPLWRFYKNSFQICPVPHEILIFPLTTIFRSLRNGNRLNHLLFVWHFCLQEYVLRQATLEKVQPLY